MKSLRKCGVLLITMALLASLAACNREPKPGPESSGVTGSSSGATGDTTTATEISSDVSQSDSSGGGDASATGSTKKPGGSKKPDTSTTTKGGGATKRPTTSQATKVFKVEDYGAKGDGKTDDGMAVANAVLAAAKDGSKEKNRPVQGGRHLPAGLRPRQQQLQAGAQRDLCGQRKNPGG